ncbi:MAG TPA: ribosome biogenesis GTP-binding protein YihA/YsxC [Candidatus Binataceae bacterium]|nr:ribosome biogenesis GTP-binding protein YihA/YsxC [Candidatus Binataceae bacterium]
MKFAAEYLRSTTTVGDYPRWNRVEVALAGRSNVGKSSLLNALTESRGLARTSKTPGRTRALNFFGLGAGLALVDLPGFGYAKMARADAAHLGGLINDYLTQREALAGLVLLIDARRGPEAEELALLAMSDRHDASGVALNPLTIVVAATKCDKLRRSQRAAALKPFAAHGLEPILCSAESGEGLEELRRRIIAIGRNYSRLSA